MQDRDGPGVGSLSPRECDCLRLLQSGLETAQAAAGLGISLSTLNKHLASARHKLGVRRTAHALLLYQRQGETARNGQPYRLEDLEGNCSPLTAR